MIIAITVALFHILGLVSSIHALMSTRTTQGTIAWIVTLITFPYLAVPAYWMLAASDSMSSAIAPALLYYCTSLYISRDISCIL